MIREQGEGEAKGIDQLLLLAHYASTLRGASYS
jgi:hypothetical protein